MKEQFLFTYGTLCRGFNNTFSDTVTAQSEYLSQGWLTGRLYEIDRFPGAIAATDGYKIYGEIYRLFNPQNTLSTLDLYEECGPGFSDPTEYIRKLIDISTFNNEQLTCWTYLYNWDTASYEEITSGNYYAFYKNRYGIISGNK